MVNVPDNIYIGEELKKNIERIIKRHSKSCDSSPDNFVLLCYLSGNTKSGSGIGITVNCMYCGAEESK